MALKVYSKKDLAKLLKVSEEFFHSEVKKTIRKDFKKELLSLGFDNPDILLDDHFNLVLADPNNHNSYFETNLSIFEYIDNDE